VTSRHRATGRAFTVIVCSCCAAEPGLSVLQGLRESIRRCRHGILVSAPCLLGKLTCAARTDGSGAMVLLQPCSTDRSPVGPPRWVGPITNPADTEAVRAWLERGDWNVGALPQRLRSQLNSVAAASSRN
jgi:hypothetical protein